MSSDGQGVLDLIFEHGSINKAAAATGIPRSTLQGRVRKAKEDIAVDGMVIQPPSSGQIPIAELVNRRIQDYAHKKAHEDSRSLLPVQMRDSLPIGIMHPGDPHVDDDGTDLALLQSHMNLINATPGLYAANVGDTTNNWVGRLARLYAQQSTSASDAWRLAEWFIGGVKKWLYVVAGNHDCWSGAGDPLKWICDQNNALYMDTEVRVNLKFPNGRNCVINCRHDFKGSSQWNPAHGPMKAVFMGVRDDIVIAGHHHESAYGVIKDPNNGQVCHAIKVASYKVFDRYAREKGFKDQHLSPCCVTVINPGLPRSHPDAIKVFWDPFAGAEYLAFLRAKHLELDPPTV